MSSIIVRFATKYDIPSLLKMHPYSKSKISFPFEEDILVAERDGKVLGAVSVGHKDVAYASGELSARVVADMHLQHVNAKMPKFSGCWVSKLYVLAEHRCQGIATKLVKESLECMKENGFTEACAGINIKNEMKTVSQHVFEKNGFKKFGSCICPLPKGCCRGVILKKTIRLLGRERMK